MRVSPAHAVHAGMAACIVSPRSSLPAAGIGRRLIFIRFGDAAYNPAAPKWPDRADRLPSWLRPPGVLRAMLNSRLWIVGRFAVVSAWLPGYLRAEERRLDLPSTYTLDLFAPRPKADCILLAPDLQVHSKTFNLPSNDILDLFGLVSSADASQLAPELQAQEIFNLQLPRTR